MPLVYGIGRYPRFLSYFGLASQSGGRDRVYTVFKSIGWPAGDRVCPRANQQNSLRAARCLREDARIRILGVLQPYL